jgi:hypothetical protein
LPWHRGYSLGFNYLEDWDKCGESNVFDYYGVKKFTTTFNRIESRYPKYITFQPLGGKDPNRVSAMSKKFIERIRDSYLEQAVRDDEYGFYLIGSLDDIKEFGPVDRCVWVTNFEDSLYKLLGSHAHYSVNSWTKTFTGLMDIKTAIYRSVYKIPPTEFYGVGVDPADHVFLNNWGFVFYEGDD